MKNFDLKLNVIKGLKYLNKKNYNIFYCYKSVWYSKRYVHRKRLFNILQINKKNFLKRDVL